MPDEMPTRFMTFLLSLRLEYSNRSQGFDYRQSDRRAGAREAQHQPFWLLKFWSLITTPNPHEWMNRLTHGNLLTV
jgi:hypothetical protein